MPNPETEVKTEVTPTPDDQANELGGANSSFADFKASAPKVVSDGKIVTKEEPDSNQKDEEFVTKAKTVPSKDDDGETKSTDDPKPDDVSPAPKVVKIGESDHTEEELKEALQDRENRSAWQKNLTMKSQIASALPDNQIELLVPYAMKQKEIPENLTEIVFKDSELPEFVELEDEDGDTVKVDLKKLPKELLEILGNNVFNKLYPDLEKMRTDVETGKKEIDENRKQIEAYQEHDATRQAIAFMKAHPDYGISIRKGETLKYVMGNILTSGDVHPELANANKFVMLINHIKRHGGTLEEAYTFFEGNNLAKSKTKSKQLENQENDISPETGKPVPKMTKAEKKLDSFRDKRSQAVAEVFG